MLQNDRWKKNKSGAGKAQWDSALETGVCVCVWGRKRGRVWVSVCDPAHAPVRVFFFTTHSCNSLKFIKKCFPPTRYEQSSHRARLPVMNLWPTEKGTWQTSKNVLIYRITSEKSSSLLKAGSSSHLWPFQRLLPGIGLMLIHLDTSTFKRDWSGEILRGGCELLKLEVAGGRGRRLWPENLHKLRARAWDGESGDQPSELANHFAQDRVPRFDNFPSVLRSFWTEITLRFFSAVKLCVARASVSGCRVESWKSSSLWKC